MLWSAVLSRNMAETAREDNTSTITVIRVSDSIALRALPKPHRVSLAYSSEIFDEKQRTLLEVATRHQRGDVCTKGLPAPSLARARLVVGHLRQGEQLSPFSAPEGLGDDDDVDDDAT